MLVRGVGVGVQSWIVWVAMVVRRCVILLKEWHHVPGFQAVRAFDHTAHYAAYVVEAMGREEDETVVHASKSACLETCLGENRA